MLLFECLRASSAVSFKFKRCNEPNNEYRKIFIIDIMSYYLMNLDIDK
ncbi:hypothetical protein I600_2979 [Maribacter dokdonensis DSW-8]|nr:hypothetical protein I600_2979 [Maribacter dokdonensis DSW-8]